MPGRRAKLSSRYGWNPASSKGTRRTRKSSISRLTLSKDMAGSRKGLLDVFAWDSRRPPYPGLMAFQEEDAGVFFGRSLEIRSGIEKLASLRRQGRTAPRFVLFL